MPSIPNFSLLLKIMNTARLGMIFSHSLLHPRQQCRIQPKWAARGSGDSTRMRNIIFWAHRFFFGPNNEQEGGICCAQSQGQCPVPISRSGNLAVILEAFEAIFPKRKIPVELYCSMTQQIMWSTCRGVGCHEISLHQTPVCYLYVRFLHFALGNTTKHLAPPPPYMVLLHCLLPSQLLLQWFRHSHHPKWTPACFGIGTPARLPDWLIGTGSWIGHHISRPPTHCLVQALKII